MKHPPDPATTITWTGDGDYRVGQIVRHRSGRMLVIERITQHSNASYTAHCREAHVHAIEAVQRGAGAEVLPLLAALRNAMRDKDNAAMLEAARNLRSL